MLDIELAKHESAEGYRGLLESIEGLSEELAWARVTCQPGEYLHTEGSILSIVAHVAGCKFIYGSAAFRNTEVRWRDIVARLEQFWPNWNAARAYLEEAHEYWLSTWANEPNLERQVPRFNGDLWPAWKIIWMVCHHDGYHAGQIQVLRSILPPTSTPPGSEADDWRKYCGDLPTW